MANNVVTPPPPPRRTGNAQRDTTTMNEWLHDFYEAVEVQNYYAKQVGATGLGEFDANDLPDPASTTAAKAQQTANEAYVLASEANARTTGDFSVTLTISDTDTSVAHTFTDDQKPGGTDYTVQVSPVSVSAAAASGSWRHKSTTKAEDSVTISVEAAPGAGESVTFDLKLEGS